MRNGYSEIATYANPIEAGMACEHLRACDIDADLTNASAASTLYGAGNPIMNQSLFVPTDRVADALEVLKKLPVESGDAASSKTPPTTPAFDGFYRSDWNSRQRAAETAYRASIIGWLVPLVSWYALWKLGEVVTSNLPLDGQTRRHAIIAGCVALLPAVGWLGALVATFFVWRFE